MGGILSPRLGVLALLIIATTFGSNHVAARIAFDHGASVTTAVAVRSGFTALVLFALMRALGVPMALPRSTLARAVSIGALIAVQSFCLYSSVARIPVALALLAFNTFPMLLALLSWATGGDRPGVRALLAMPVALAGLALALDVVGKAGDIAGRWQEIGAGVGWAIGAAISFALALLLTARWLKEVDGRLRTFLMMGVTAILVIVAGIATDSFDFPAAPAGWIGLALLTVFYGSAITALFIVLPHLGTANYAVVLNFEPIALMFMAWIALGQAMNATQVLGAFLVVGAVTYLATGKR
ncbi:MAG: DMT family transporter [Betaproteobacteria bacterium]|nr:DMT family transporter [Betaproteobacteria bacterium]